MSYQVSLHVGILGAGAMGCLFGARMQASGTRVTLVDVDTATVAAIRRCGVELTLDDGVRSVPIEAYVAQQLMEPPDAWFVFTKSHHTRSALQSVRHLFNDQTTVVSLQNGLGHLAVLDEFRPRDRVAVGITTYPSRLVAPGRIESHGDGVVRLMARDGQAHPFVHLLARSLNDAGLHTAVDAGVMVAIWEKVAFNAALNGICGVTRCTVDQVGTSEHTLSLAHAVVREVLAVARAQGLAVDESRTLATVDDVIARHKGHRPSMLQDLLAGRRTEVDAIHGAVVQEARRLALQVPLTWALDQLVRLSELVAVEFAHGGLDPATSHPASAGE